MMRQEISPPSEQPEHSVWFAHTKQFATNLFENLSQDERMEIDRSSGDLGFVEDALAYALRHPERFKRELIDLVQSLELISGGKQLFDTVHNGGLAVDQQGNLVVIRSQEMNVNFNKDPSEMGDSTYEMLTGSDKGNQYSTRTHPLKKWRATGSIAEA